MPQKRRGEQPYFNALCSAPLSLLQSVRSAHVAGVLPAWERNILNRETSNRHTNKHLPAQFLKGKYESEWFKQAADDGMYERAAVQGREQRVAQTSNTKQFMSASYSFSMMRDTRTTVGWQGAQYMHVKFPLSCSMSNALISPMTLIRSKTERSMRDAQTTKDACLTPSNFAFGSKPPFFVVGAE
jgi:hypothetical protein